MLLLSLSRQKQLQYIHIGLNPYLSYLSQSSIFILPTSIILFTAANTGVLKNRTIGYMPMDLYEGKSLARPGRKQATATKLGIYSTYSPRGSIHFLARCSNF